MVDDQSSVLVIRSSTLRFTFHPPRRHLPLLCGYGVISAGRFGEDGSSASLRACIHQGQTTGTTSYPLWDWLVGRTYLLIYGSNATPSRPKTQQSSLADRLTTSS